MSNNTTHISEYLTLGKTLVLLLVLTFITIFVTEFDLKAWNVTIALLIACTKVFVVLSIFMHLKYESLLFKILVGMVFLLFFLVVVITFFDYLFR
jgi:cytochrome c oxidase subunit IV